MSLSEFHDEQPNRTEGQYRPISGMSVLAFGLAILSLTAWMTVIMVSVSIAGIIVAVVALRRIATSDPPMLGKKLALVALFLSAICASGPTADYYTHRMLLRREAREFADYWFSLQLNRELKIASLMVRAPGSFFPNAPSPTEEGAAKSASMTRLDAFQSHPAVRAVAALGSKAQVRYYDTEKQEFIDGKETLRHVYAVTYDNNGVKTSFFIRLWMERKVPESKPVGFWTITMIEGGIRPLALGGQDKA